MKTNYNLFLTYILILLAGCSDRNLLVKRFRDHNVTQNNITKLKFIGSENSGTGGVLVVIENPEVIQSVWKSISLAKPTDLYYFSGELEIEFYTSNSANNPSAKLMLNESDGAYLDGDLWYHLDSNKEGYYGLWKCSGLNKLVIGYLREEYQQRKRSI